MALAVPVDDTPIPVRDDPSGLAYVGDTLYVADGYSGAVVRITNGTQQRIATIDAAGVISPDRIGGIATTPHGTLYVARIGHGHTGAIFRVQPDGVVEELDGLPARFWRYGLAYDTGEHALYATQFMSGKRGAFDGSVVAIDLVSGTPSTVIDGFLKPMGIAKLGSTLVVADARQRAVFRIDTVAGRAVFRLQLAADVDRPDSICACGSDSVLVTTYDDETRLGAVRRFWLDGKRSAVIARGPWEPRGIATDGARIFVAAHRAARVLVFAL
jgi:DNA-binding beta-propeller fold protein YncE